MAMALKSTFRTICIAALMMIGFIGSAYAADTEAEEESYYLSQMRDLANSKKGQPEAEAPTPSGELMAETDLEKMAKAAAEVEELDDISPSLSKPELPTIKPEL